MIMCHSGNRGADQLHGLQLICAFVFAYAKGRFSHDAAHILKDWKKSN